MLWHVSACHLSRHFLCWCFLPEGCFRMRQSDMTKFFLHSSTLSQSHHVHRWDLKVMWENVLMNGLYTQINAGICTFTLINMRNQCEKFPYTLYMKHGPITLLPFVGKFYAFYLCLKLVSWLESENVLGRAGWVLKKAFKAESLLSSFLPGQEIYNLPKVFV